MNIALIGLPQAGKRTLFTLLTSRPVPPDRKPGEIAEGIAPIHDPRVDKLAELYKPKSIVYAENHFVLCPDADISGASHAWLTAAAKCDLLCIVLRAFESDNVYHPSGSVDAERDRKNLEDELLLSDLEIVEKRLARIEKESRAGLSPVQKLEQQTLLKCQSVLNEEHCISEANLEPNEIASLLNLNLVTNKPRICLYNVSEDNLSVDTGGGSLTVSCQIEQEIAEIESPGEQAEYMDALGITSSGLDRVNAKAYDALGLMSFYTVGKDECRAWTIRKGSSAPVAGGKIHTDIQRGFIRVEVIKYDDLIELGSEQTVKQDGKMQTRGKDYTMEDGNICHFLFNV
jgi:GTP-binding protein YchF